MAALAARLAPVEAPGLRVDQGLGFAALRPAGRSPELDALAAETVRALDPFRAPPDEAELARRRAHGLDPTGEALLARWGYPYVMERFRFHVTLTGRLPMGPARAALLARIEAHFGAVLDQRFHLSALSLFGDPGGGEPFRALKRYALSG